MINFRSVEDIWFNKFVQLITENRKVTDLPETFSSLRVISFNYDRCFEQFLYFAIQNYYRIDASTAADLLAPLEIYHPYGRVGSLPWQKQEIPIEFGAEPRSRNLLDIAGQIRTFTEGTGSESGCIENIRVSVAESDRLIFLGFAFHPMNMRLLASSKGEKNSRVSFGTALGMSNSDKAILENEVTSLMGSKITSIELRNDLTCSKLLDEYKRSFTLL